MTPEAGPLLAALLAGLVGSVHCLGMCGGIASAMGMAAARRGVTGSALLGRSLLNNLGRIGSYALAGMLAGSLGMALGEIIDTPFWALLLRGLTGLLLILLGLQLAFGWRLLGFLESGGARLWQRIAPTAGRLLASPGPASALGLGALWGWLPCGLSYSLLLVAAASGSAAGGAAIMLAFGAGTLPSMLLSGLAAARLGAWLRRPGLKAAAGALIVLFGAWTAAVPLRHAGHPAAAEGAGHTEPGHAGH